MFQHLKVGAVFVVGCGLLAGAGSAENAGTGWSGSYSFSSSNDRYARAEIAHMMKRAEEGYYEDIGKTTYTTTYTTVIDRSVGDVSVGDGSHSDIEFHTGEESGTRTYTVGAVNTSTTDISVGGQNNTVDVANGADSKGCQDGRIIVAGVSGFDISAKASASNNSPGAC